MKAHKHKGLTCLTALTLATVAAFFTGGFTSTGEQTITKQEAITAGIVIDNKDNIAEAIKVVRNASTYITNGEAIYIDWPADYLITSIILSQNLIEGQTHAIKSLFRRFNGNLPLKLDKVGVDPEIVICIKGTPTTLKFKGEWEAN